MHMCGHLTHIRDCETCNQPMNTDIGLCRFYTNNTDERTT